MPQPATILLVFLVWLVFCLLCQRIANNPRGDMLAGLLWYFIKAYVRLFHLLRITGREHVPRAAPIDGRPIIVIANHTAGLDAVLIQAVCPFFIRWLMAADMRVRRFDGLWDYLQIIDIQRGGATEVSGMRTAMRHLKDGGTLGIFPEGRLQVVRNQLHPFHHGTGLLIARSNALVLPCVIAGTPHCSSSWTSLFVPSRSRLRIMPLIDFSAEGVKAADIAANLQRRYEGWVRELVAS